MKTVLITGANRGIGLALARAYLERGTRVIATCRHPEKAEALQTLSREGKPVRILPLEVTDAQSIAALAAALEGTPIDVLINNAGVLSGINPELSAVQEDESQTFGTINADGFLKILAVNTVAPAMIAQALFKNVCSGQDKKIIMISSGWGSIEDIESELPPLGYGASKAALNAVMRRIACDAREKGVIVASVTPGWVETDMGGQGADWTPQESAARMIAVIDGLSLAQTGLFIKHSGELIPW